MSKRDAALMRRVLKWADASPERFAGMYPEAVLFYSARTLRRWLAGDPMPPFVRDRLESLTSPTE